MTDTDLQTDWDRLVEAELTHDKPLADTELAHIGAHHGDQA
jgi:hypothetical protein